MDSVLETLPGWSIRKKRRIHLSFFDGIGSSALALEALGVPTMAHIAWETDPDCILFSQEHFKDIEHRGDISRDTAEKLIERLNVIDPELEAELIVISAPPCPDFSKIRGDNAPGRAGPEGMEFDMFVQFLKALEAQCGRTTKVLIENVIFGNKEEADHFSNETQAKPVMVCASDLHLIRRARLWWSRIDWKALPLKKNSFEVYLRIQTPQAWRDKSLHRCVKVLNIPAGACLREDVASGKRLMACLTTPAASEQGRPPPRNAQRTPQRRPS